MRRPSDGILIAYRSLQHVQYVYTFDQLDQHRWRDLFYAHGDQTLRSHPPICYHIPKVRCEQQPTERLSQSSNHLQGSPLRFRWR